MSGQGHTFKLRISRRATKRITREISPGRTSTTWADDGTESADITVTLDLAAIARDLGVRAMSSKAKKSTALSGAVIARAENFSREGQS